MPPKPRWTHPVNFRSEDKEILEGALKVARNEGSNLTNIIRDALRLYVSSKLLSEGTLKLDQFVDNSKLSHFRERPLTLEEIKSWSDEEVLRLAKQIRGKQQQLQFELKKRGFYFSW